MRILMIHGRAQGGKDPEILKETWINTLKQSYEAANLPFPSDLHFDFPFYAEALDEFTRQAGLPSPADVVKKGTGQDLEFEQFMQSVLDEMKTGANIADDDVEAEMEIEVVEKGIQNWEWVQAIARAIDRHFTGVADFTIEMFLKDVFLYVTKPAVTRGINGIIEEYLSDEPTLVIGHSLGSVVGYKVLVENRNRLNLIKYITLGCPLGIKSISGKLGLLENPGGENGWYNGYDERDVVALNPLNDTFFPTEKPIANVNTIDNFTDNHHGIIGYLNSMEIARQISGG